MDGWEHDDELSLRKTSSPANSANAVFGIRDHGVNELVPTRATRDQNFFSSAHSRQGSAGIPSRPILADKRLLGPSPAKVPIVPGKSLSTNNPYKSPPAAQQAASSDQRSQSKIADISALELPAKEAPLGSGSLSVSENIKAAGLFLSKVGSTTIAKVFGSSAKKPVLTLQAPAASAAQRRSLRSETKIKSPPVTIDLLDSDDDENESKNRDNDANPLLTSIAANYPSTLAPFTTSVGSNGKIKPQLTQQTCQVSKSRAFEAKCISLGLLIYHSKMESNDSSSLCSVQISSVGPHITYILTATSIHGVRGDCQIDDEYVTGPFIGTLDSSPDIAFIGMTAREGLRLKSVAVGHGRVLCPAPARKAGQNTPPSSPYIFIFLSVNEQKSFISALERLPRGQQKGASIGQARPAMQEAANRIWHERLDDSNGQHELFSRAEVEKTDMLISERDGTLGTTPTTRSSRRARLRACDDIDYSDPELRKTFLIYPPEPEATDAVTLCRGDLQRLQPGVYYNDNLIDLRIKLLRMDLSEERREKIHAFSCHFYSKMTERGMTVAKESHDLVARWTKNVKLFEMDYVFFPINLYKHWSLAVLVRPGLLWTTEGVLSVLERRKRRKQKEGVEVTPLCSPDDVLEEVELGDEGREEEKEEEKDEACLLFLDSLSMHPYTKICRGLAAYLYYERQVRREELGLERDDVTEAQFMSALSVVKGHAPRQQNGYDCGVYVTHFTHMIMTLWPSSRPTDQANKFGNHFSNHFSQSDIDDERVRFNDLVHKHHETWKELRRSLGQDGENEGQGGSRPPSRADDAVENESKEKEVPAEESNLEPSAMDVCNTVEEAEMSDGHGKSAKKLANQKASKVDGTASSSDEMFHDSEEKDDWVVSRHPAGNPQVKRPAAEDTNRTQPAAEPPSDGTDHRIRVQDGKKRRVEGGEEGQRSSSWRSVIESRGEAARGDASAEL